MINVYIHYKNKYNSNGGIFYIIKNEQWKQIRKRKPLKRSDLTG